MPNIREIERLRAEHAAIETLSRFLLALVGRRIRRARPNSPRCAGCYATRWSAT